MIDPDRSHAFRILAQKFATGHTLRRPITLSTPKRRVYLRDTLLEDNHQRIIINPAETKAKFRKLSQSPFTFFRGNALIFYRDIVGYDLDMPHVFCVGDVHPANYGVMPSDDGAPFFGLNDFDEAAFAPFAYDLRRGVTGFCLTARENGFSETRQRKIVNAFLDGYIEAIKLYSHNDYEKWQTWRIDNSPKKIRRLLEKSIQSRVDFLAAIAEFGYFNQTDEVTILSDRVAEFQEYVALYREQSEILPDRPDSFFRVKDVARKKASGTASFGQMRYLVLLEGPTIADTDDIILEFKLARRPALYGLVPGNEMPDNWHAKRMVTAHDVHIVGGDPYFGHVEIDSQSFMVRELSPYKRRIDWEKLNRKEMARYAQFCGQVLAQAHARSDMDTGLGDKQVEPLIFQAIEENTAFKESMTEFAFEMAARTVQDYELYVADYERGYYDLERRDTADFGLE